MAEAIVKQFQRALNVELQAVVPHFREAMLQPLETREDIQRSISQEVERVANLIDVLIRIRVEGMLEAIQREERAKVLELAYQQGVLVVAKEEGEPAWKRR